MQNRIFSDAWFKAFFILLTAVWFYLFSQTADVALQGTHQWRQADTLFTAYFFCTESPDMMRPRVGPRGDTSGIAVGEFPFYSMLVAQWCLLKGSWDEVSPKVINLILCFLALWAWWIFLRNHFGLKQVKWFHWFGLSFYSIISLSYFTIPMPEVTALLFFGIGGALWSSRRGDALGKWDWGGTAAFCFGFLLRPYHIPFLVLFQPRMRIILLNLVICVLLFGFWYRYWPAQVTELQGYYGINFESLGKIMQALPGALSVVPARIMEHFGLIGLLLLPIVWKRQPLLVLIYLGSIAMMVVLKATHLRNHAYYLMNAAMLALVIMIYGLEQWTSETKRNLFIVALAIIGFANTFHNLLPGEAEFKSRQLEALAAQIPPDAKVIAYTGAGPSTLYWLKRKGWAAEAKDWIDASSCPAAAQHYITVDDKSQFTLGRCLHANQ